MPSWTNPLLGGLLIGVAVSLNLLGNGRITGMSGLMSGMLDSKERREPWRWFLLLGLLFAGIQAHFLLPDAFTQTEQPLWLLGLAGLLVGFGTRVGGGCTSGHGICGVSGLSPRSLVATATFMAFGVLTRTLIVRLF